MTHQSRLLQPLLNYGYSRLGSSYKDSNLDPWVTIKATLYFTNSLTELEFELEEDWTSNLYPIVQKPSFNASNNLEHYFISKQEQPHTFVLPLLGTILRQETTQGSRLDRAYLIKELDGTCVTARCTNFK